MTRRRLPDNPEIASRWRRGGGAGEPAAHPVPPRLGRSTLIVESGAEPTPADDLPWLLNSRQVARLLGIGRTKAFQLMARRELPVVQIGRCVRVPKSELAQWISARALGSDA
jgi:excisionase family DNA binding protein